MRRVLAPPRAIDDMDLATLMAEATPQIGEVMASPASAPGLRRERGSPLTLGRAIPALSEFPHLMAEARRIQAGELPAADASIYHLVAYQHLVETLLAVVKELQETVELLARDEQTVAPTREA